MCGICGTVGRGVESELAAMTEALAHRGPDGSGIAVFNDGYPAGVGNRRLAIQDPTAAGAQPMSHENRWWITYNGEIYNFRELRHDLEREGERFRSGSDTEVLLRLFVLRGPSML
jgi:asparagine synthase (glutamine-hydrolysing)